MIPSLFPSTDTFAFFVTLLMSGTIAQTTVVSEYQVAYIVSLFTASSRHSVRRLHLVSPQREQPGSFSLAQLS